MLGLVVCAAVLGSDLAPPPANTYAEARALAGRSPDDQVRLALWCEARGMVAERWNHLAMAVLADPGHAAARGLMGLVAYRGQWRRPEAVADRLGSDALLAEYQARRLEAPYTAEGQWALGLWSEARGLKDQARAHYTAVTRLDPRRAEAWKRLGCRIHEGRWITDEQRTAERAESEAQARADRRWKPLLEDYRRWLAYPSRRAEAEAGLAGLTDPRAVPSIVRVFAGVGPEQPRAVQLLGQVDTPAASRALALLAVAARSAQARRAATETLRGRDPREYAELLIGLLREPIRFEVKHVGGPDSPGELLVEGKRANLRRVYAPPSVFRPDDQLGRDASGMPVVLRAVEPGGTATRKASELLDAPAGPTPGSWLDRGRMTGSEARAALAILQDAPGTWPNQAEQPVAFRFGDKAEIPLGQMAVEARKSSAATERQLREDVRLLEDRNLAVRIGNDRVAGVLNDATGQSIGPDPRPWARWYRDQVGYASLSSDWTSRTARVEDASIAYQPPTLPENSSRQILGYSVDCFAGGTIVRTIAGPRPIESLQVGDQVLTQSTATGALDYQPVVVLHRNPPSPTFRVRSEGGSVITSPFHRFWVAGRGWVMARDLKPGDPVRTLGGVAPVEAVASDEVQPVFNLDVAGDADFFAGPAAALVHDHTPPDLRLVPFDAAPATAARVVAARR
jgi:hypothetical protein